MCGWGMTGSAEKTMGMGQMHQQRLLSERVADGGSPISCQSVYGSRDAARQEGEAKSGIILFCHRSFLMLVTVTAPYFLKP